MAKRVKVRRRRPAADLGAAQFAGEGQAFTLALAGWGLGLAALVAGLWLVAALRTFSYALLALTLLSLFAFALLIPSLEIGQVRGLGRRVVPPPGSELAIALERFARALLLQRRPTVVLAPGPPATETLGDLIVITEPVRDQLQPVEVRALLAVQMGHIAVGHRPWLALRRRVRNAHRLLRTTLAIPLWPLVLGLGPWERAARCTGLRIATLLVGDPRVVATAALKLAVLRDPESEVVVEEVEQFQMAPSKGGVEESRVSAHYKMNQFLTRNGDLNEQVHDLSAFAATDQYRELGRALRARSMPAARKPGGGDESEVSD